MRSIFDKTSHTIGELVLTVLEIDNERDARAFAEAYGEWIARTYPKESWQEVLRANIGWCFGEGMTQERVDMWVRVCGASHPIAGTKLDTTPDQAFAAGMEWAKRKAT
jgi:hypothetical protein